MSARAWFVVCVDEDRPDGPGDVFGPFVTREQAVADADEGFCESNHVVVYGPGSPRVRSSNSQPWVDSFHWYVKHRDAIPVACRHLFRGEFVAAS